MRWHRPLLALTAAMAALTLVTVAGLVADDRTLLGAPIWLKPFKFALSFAVYAATLAWMLAVLPRRSRLAEWAATVVVAASVIEVAIITFQAARGHRSHFNDTTPFDSLLFSIMGASVMVLFVAHLGIGIVALRQRIPDPVSAYVIRLGLLLSLLGMLAAIPMVTPLQDTGIAGISGAHAVGVPDGGPGLPVTGWSTTGGDLRIGHFVGLHGLQFLPLLAMLLTWLSRRGERTGARGTSPGERAGGGTRPGERAGGRTSPGERAGGGTRPGERAGAGRTVLSERINARLILVAGVAYAGMVLLLTWQAWRGQPLLRPDALTLGALATLIAATLTATTAVIKSGWSEQSPTLPGGLPAADSSRKSGSSRSGLWITPGLWTTRR